MGKLGMKLAIFTRSVSHQRFGSRQCAPDHWMEPIFPAGPRPRKCTDSTRWALKSAITQFLRDAVK
jgi:hypothetical protein